jgi:Na+:H+ antiporter, NhaA family
MGSILSAIAGYAILRFAPLHPMHDAVEAEQRAEIARDGDIDTVEEDEKGL